MRLRVFGSSRGKIGNEVKRAVKNSLVDVMITFRVPGGLFGNLCSRVSGLIFELLG